MFQSLFFNKVADLRPATALKKRIWRTYFFCELCEISKNTFYYITSLVAAVIVWNDLYRCFQANEAVVFIHI